VNLNSRLRWLERDRPSETCPACGLPRHGPLTGVRIKVNRPAVFERYKSGKAEEQPQDFCAGCGRQMVFRLGLVRPGWA
jgi:hypothetical protein